MNYQKDKIRIVAEVARLFQDEIFLYIIKYEDKKRHLGKLKFSPIDEGVHFHSPESSCELDLTASQELMDTLWQCGVRPTEAKGSAGQLTAIQSHLADLQKLVFKIKNDNVT